MLFVDLYEWTANIAHKLTLNILILILILILN